MSKDPTRTLTIRRRAASQINKRFKSVRRQVVAWVKESTELIKTNEGEDFTFSRDTEKVEAFTQFLQRLIDEEILFIENGGTVSDHWLVVSVGESYRRGAVKTRSKVEASIPQMQKLPNYSPLSNPAHIDRADLIFQRTFENLTGVTNTMADQMRRVLSEGILQGKNPNVVARELADRVDKIGITRARLIARTEIVESHNTASITEGEILERDTGVEIKMRWITSLDGRERDTHRTRHDNLYSREEAQSLIGEPNCRCSVTPHVDLKALLNE